MSLRDRIALRIFSWGFAHRSRLLRRLGRLLMSPRVFAFPPRWERSNRHVR